jgi:CheY-like chemotaxis protein
MKEKILDILLVEDNESHAELVIDCLEDNHIHNSIYWMENGRDALDYLYRKGRFSDPKTSPRPHIIMLDLRLPKVDGLEVLKTIKSDEDLLSIPVVILTSSASNSDIDAAYKLHANSFLTKPIKFEDFYEMMKSFGFYWLICNKEQSPD